MRYFPVLSPYFNVFSGKLQYNFALFKIGKCYRENDNLAVNGGMEAQKTKNLVLITFTGVDASFSCVYDNATSGRSGDRGPALSGSRKVRTL